MRKRIRNLWMPLLLSFTLILGPTASVAADLQTGGGNQTEYAGSYEENGSSGDSSYAQTAGDRKHAASDSDQTGNAQTASEGNASENMDASDKMNASENMNAAGEIDAADGSDHEDDVEAAQQEKSDEADKQEKLDEAEQQEKSEEAESTKDEENPEATPYKEILSDEALILVTVSDSEPDSGTIEEETVEELSETEILALEEYVEEQGYAVTKEAMLAAVPKTVVRTITFNMNGFISLAAEGYGYGYDAMFYIKEGDFQGNPNGYCINPSVQAPGHDAQGREVSYMASVTSYSDPMLLKILYYGFGGPGDISGKYASGGPARHILTHMVATKRAAELGIPGSGEYTYRANDRAIGLANQLYAAIKAQDAINGSVSVFTPVPGQQTIMLLSSFSVPPKEIPKTEITVKKTVSGTGGNKNTEFHFKLTVFSAEGKAETVKNFTLQHGQTVTFKDLPQGVRYQVEELDGESQGYTVTSQKASGVLGKDPVQVTFENNKEMIVPTGVEVNTFEMGGISLLALFAGMFFLVV